MLLLLRPSGHANISQTDTGTGTETGFIGLILVDTGAGVDDAVLSVALTLTDSGSASDLYAILAALSGSDSGTGTDSDTGGGAGVGPTDTDYGRGFVYEWILYVKQGTLLSAATSGLDSEGSMNAPDWGDPRDDRRL